MLYTVKIVSEGIIRTILDTNDLDKAIQYELHAAELYGKENVWVCDNIQEIMVG